MLLGTIILAFAVRRIVAMHRCPVDWIEWNRSCYMKVPTPMLWDDVRHLCHSFSSRMGVPSSDEENKFFTEIFLKTGHDLWIDCTDRGEEGTWVCSEDDPPATGYRNWHVGNNQPNDYPPPKGADYAVIEQPNGQWADMGDRLYHAMCEIQSECAPSTQCRVIADREGDATIFKCLLGRIVNEITVKNAVQCCVACFKASNCRSFNLIRVEGGRVCQLNDVTRAHVGADSYVSVDNCVHYEL